MFTSELALNIRQKINRYDPYGLMQVNAAQATFVVICLLFVDGIFNLPSFTKAINLPILGFVITGNIFGYYPRLKAMLFFSIACMIYTALLFFMSNYISLLVIITGLFISGIFALSKKFYPPFLTMVALIQCVASTLLSQTPNTGDTYQILQMMADLGAVSLLTLLFMSLFPKIYFFRVWRRALSCALEELEEKLRCIQSNILDTQRLLLNHSVRLFDLTKNLSYEEKGFFARRIALLFTRIYTSLAALATSTTSMKSHEIQSLINLSHDFCIALNIQKPLENFLLIQSNNIDYLIFHEKIKNMIQAWNKSC